METNLKSTKNLWFVVISGLLAILFDYLFFNKMFGVSVLIYGILVLGALFLFAKSKSYSLKPALWLVLPFLFFCAIPLVRDNPFLRFLDSLGALGMYLLMVRALTGDSILNFSFLDYILTAILWPFKFAGRGISKGLNLIRGAGGIQKGKSRQVLIGVLTALPVLVFFGVLFVSADLAFSQFIEKTFQVHLPDTAIPQVIVVGVIFTLCLGLFAYLTNPSDKISKDISELLNFRSGTETNREIEISVFLSLIAALFLLFIAFQVHYLFGGAANIYFQGFTYAEYARKGFWELLVVAFTTLLILLAVDNHSKDHAARLKWFILPALAIIVEVLIIVASAFKRLALYQSAYGMTSLRLYVFGFIIFLAVIFVIFGAKIILNKKHSFFAFGVLLSVIVFLVGMNLLNPDKFIAEKNIHQFNQTNKLDNYYLLTLSADAAPTVLQNFKPQTDEDKIARDNYIENLTRYLSEQRADWQSYNIARAKAWNELQKN
ncbi:MAG TPA: DUF4173 domain-containing protein [Patescibacteria group bacterium]|nr:DUF4173 domain-containing protein [Patescibacteria group bacterium]